EQTSDDKDSQGNPIPDNQKSWQIVGDVNGSSTSFNVSGLSDGLYFFRVRAIYPGQIGSFVTAGSSSVKVVVSQRTLVDITTQVSVPFTNLSYNNTTKLVQEDLALVNNSNLTYLPNIDLRIVAIQSASGTVRVTNSENGGDGTSMSNAALYNYNQQLGSAQQFTPGQQTATRPVLFSDRSAEMFTFDVDVTAYLGSGGGSSSS